MQDEKTLDAGRLSTCFGCSDSFGSDSFSSCCSGSSGKTLAGDGYRSRAMCSFRVHLHRFRRSAWNIFHSRCFSARSHVRQVKDRLLDLLYIWLDRGFQGLFLGACSIVGFWMFYAWLHTTAFIAPVMWVSLIVLWILAAAVDKAREGC